MSTHKTQCTVCGIDCYCSNDEHALGCGGDHGEGGCDNPPYIEFCSLEHAFELHRRLAISIQNYYEVTETPVKQQSFTCLTELIEARNGLRDLLYKDGHSSTIDERDKALASLDIAIGKVGQMKCTNCSEVWEP